MVTGSAVPDSELLAGPALTELTPGVGTIVVTIRRLITLRTDRGRCRRRPAQGGVRAIAQLVGEQGEERGEERDRAPENQRRGSAGGWRGPSQSSPPPWDSCSTSPPPPPPPLVAVVTGEPEPEEPEPALAPLVWVTTGEALPPPEPALPP